MAACWRHYPAWCSIRCLTLFSAVCLRGPSLGGSNGSDLAPYTSFGCNETKFWSVHACIYCSKDPDIHVLDWWMPSTKKAKTNKTIACTILDDGMWLLLGWIEKKKKKNPNSLRCKILTQNGGLQRTSLEQRNRNLILCVQGIHGKLFALMLQ